MKRTVISKTDDVVVAMDETLRSVKGSYWVGTKRLTHAKLRILKCRINLIRRVLGLPKWVWPK